MVPFFQRRNQAVQDMKPCSQLVFCAHAANFLVQGARASEYLAVWRQKNHCAKR